MSIQRSLQRQSDRTRLTKLVQDLLNGGMIPAGVRDQTLARAAASMASVGLRRDIADQAMRDLHARMEQPSGDIYPLGPTMRKLDIAFRQPWAGAFQRDGVARQDHPNTPPVTVMEYERPGKATQEQLDAPYTATPVLFKLPASPVGDQDRIQRLWNQNIPALPIPVGTKAGNERVRPPRWKHLQDGRPTESDWKYWSNPEYARGNTAIVMGHAGDAVCFGVIEVEYAEDFEAHADRDYFLANTPVVASAKSRHIWLLQRVGTKALGWQPTRSDNDGDPNKHLPVRHEFRGAGSIDTAPGSIHQSGAVYTQVNPDCKTILEVENIPAFVHHYFPTLFKAALTLQTLDTVQPRWEMEIAELFADAPKLGFIKRPDLKGRSMVDMTDQEGKDLAEFEDAATLESRRQLSEIRNKELYGFRRLATTALETFPPGGSGEPDAELGPLGGLPSKNWGPNSALEAIPILMPDPQWFPTPEAMEALLGSVMDSGDQRLRDYRMCGWLTKGVCDEHGERFRTHRTCKAGYDPRCPTKLTMKLRQLHLPDLDLRGEKYRMLHLTRWVQYEKGQSKSLAMGRVHTEFVEAVARIAHRKVEHSGVDMMMRSTAYQIGRDGFYITYKLVLGELDAEKANETLLALTVALEAQVWGQRVTPRAEAAVVQMMEDSMYSFIGFVPGENLTLDEQGKLFVEYLAAVRHRHMAEPLSSTKFYMEYMQWHDEPARCDICDRKLNWQIEKPEWLKERERAHAPPQAA